MNTLLAGSAMKVNGIPYRTIWPTADAVEIIDQTRLPHEFVTLRLNTMRDAERGVVKADAGAMRVLAI